MHGCYGGHAWLLQVERGHAWLLGGVHGCSGGCMVARGACMVALGGCVVALGGMSGCSGGGHAWDMTRYGDMVNNGGYASYWNAFLFMFASCFCYFHYF